MSRILAALARHAAATPSATAIEGQEGRLDYAGLQAAVTALAAQLAAARPRVVALHAQNGIAWAVADLAALAAGVPCVPLPTFFSPGQRAHALAAAGADLLLSDTPGLVQAPLRCGPARPFYKALWATPLRTRPATLPEGTVKITFTSGTTGTPKGVCLGAPTIEAVAESLQVASAASPADRHLALLPLATLLENLAGLYVPLLTGATTCLLPASRIGLDGSSGIDSLAMLEALGTARASTAVLVPQLLQALVSVLRAGAPRPPDLRFLALGGAVVSPRLLLAAAALRLPVFEGYGLSECASVVALNRPGDHVPGCVGRPLPHVEVAIDRAGAIRVRGAGFLGYLGQTPRDASAWVDTGDLGHLDHEGRLHVTGRRKDIFITAYGRNVAPEWVEGELNLQPAIARAAVFGEGRLFNVAVLQPRGSQADWALDAAVANANRELPDYARIRAWVRADSPFCPANGFLTANGRLCRAAIGEAYREAIDHCYQEETDGLLH